MPRRVHSSRGLSRPPRRKSSWEDGPGIGTAAQTPITASVSQVLNGGQQVLVDGLTLVRLRGQYRIQIVSSAAISEHLVGAIGIGVVNSEAFAVGAAAMLMPVTERSWNGWIYWSPIQLATLSANVATDREGFYSQTIPIDTKAMRKLDIGDTIYAAVEFSESGTIVANHFMDSRMLLKLP